MRKDLFISCIVLFAVLFCLPALQNILNFIPQYELSGVEEYSPLPEITVKSWADRSFQRGFESWYSKIYGLRAYFIRTDNQINYTLFNQVNSQLVLGKQNQLFEPAYITDYLNWNSIPKNSIQILVQKLKRLQQYLEKHNVIFLFVITPSKVSVYPEYIPEYYLKYKNNHDESNYLKFIPFLKQYDVNYLDGQAFCDNLKQTSAYQLFPKGGTHWNYYTAFLFTQLMMNKIKNMLKHQMDYLELKKVEILDTTLGTDADLAELTNMWDTSPFLEKSIFPVVEKIQIPDGTRPKILFIGGSFVHTILYWLNKFEIIDRSSEFYYYFRNKKIADRNREVFSKDAIIIEVNKSNIEQVGFGFIEAVLEKFDIVSFNQEVSSSFVPESTK